MIRLMILADDITGALDTGVQFASCGAVVRVVHELTDRVPVCDVVVVNTESRHLSADEAYSKIHWFTSWAIEHEIPIIYKKTDSALRGNIGAELSAVLDASGQERLIFIPAFPQIKRTTVQGIHYIDGVPVAESVFGQDPFEPVRLSSVCDLIRLQSNYPTQSFPSLKNLDDVPTTKGIQVYDSATLSELEQTGHLVMRSSGQRVYAGCAGFGAIVSKASGFGDPCTSCADFPAHRFLVVCGSVNPITRTQMDHAEAQGFMRIRLTPAQKLETGYWQTDTGRAELNDLLNRLRTEERIILDSNDADDNRSTNEYAAAHGLTISDLRVRISQTMGFIVDSLLTEAFDGGLLVTGGDTLVECVRRMNVYELEPIGELYPGVVSAVFDRDGRTQYVISKSGGFGEPELFMNLADRLKNAELPRCEL